MVGCGGEERKGILFVSSSVHFLDFYALGVFHLSCTNVQNKNRIHCFWASGLLVQQQAYLYDTCNWNIQTKLSKGKCVYVLFFFFFYTEYLLCAMFTESLKLCIWPFLQHWWQSCGFGKKILCFFPSFSHFHPKLHFFPHHLPLSSHQLRSLGWCIGPHLSTALCINGG